MIRMPSPPEHHVGLKFHLTSKGSSPRAGADETGANVKKRCVTHYKYPVPPSLHICSTWPLCLQLNLKYVCYCSALTQLFARSVRYIVIPDRTPDYYRCLGPIPTAKFPSQERRKWRRDCVRLHVSCLWFPARPYRFLVAVDWRRCQEVWCGVFREHRGCAHHELFLLSPTGHRDL